MDIRDWPLSDIMQLPDFVFGAQRCLSEYVGTSAASVNYFKVKEKPPYWFVIWSILIEGEKQSAATWVNLSLRLGNNIPTAGTMPPLDRLIDGKGSKAQFYDWHLPAIGLKHITGLRILVNGKGRSIVGAIKMVGETEVVENMVSVFITPIPKHAPDWLVAR